MEVWQLLELDVYILRLFRLTLCTIEFFYHIFQQIRILICYKPIFFGINLF